MPMQTRNTQRAPGARTNSNQKPEIKELKVILHRLNSTEISEGMGGRKRKRTQSSVLSDKKESSNKNLTEIRKNETPVATRRSLRRHPQETAITSKQTTSIRKQTAKKSTEKKLKSNDPKLQEFIDDIILADNDEQEEKTKKSSEKDNKKLNFDEVDDEIEETTESSEEDNNKSLTLHRLNLSKVPVETPTVDVTSESHLLDSSHGSVETPYRFHRLSLNKVPKKSTKDARKSKKSLSVQNSSGCSSKDLDMSIPKKRNLFAPKTVSSPQEEMASEKQSKGQEEDDVYEFDFSQSSANEIEDESIIRKLVQEGKAQIKRKNRVVGTRNKKKKYVKTNQIWHKIEKNLGLKTEKKNETVTSKSTQAFEGLHEDMNLPVNLVEEDNKSTEDKGVNKTVASVNSFITKAVVHTPPTGILKNDPKLQIAAKPAVKRVSFSPQIPKTKKLNKQELLQFASSVVGKEKRSHFSTPNGKNIKDNSDISPILPFVPWRAENNISSNQNESIQVIESSDVMNCSNAENIPPHEESTIIEGNRIIGSQQASNQRSPLKAINIIGVACLPPIRSVKNLSVNKLTSPKKFGVETPVERSKVSKNNTVEDYFGFDEIEEKETDNANTTVIPEKTKFKKKLKNLQKLFPPEQTRENKKTPFIFNEPTTKQRNLREMLCSTMIETRSTAKKRNKFQESLENDEDLEDDDVRKIPIEKNTQNEHQKDLFEDLTDLESVIDSTKIQRTYSRGIKKQKNTKFFTVWSDESEAEEEEEHRNKKKQRKETKKNREEKINKKELDKFAEEFNSMCEEAEHYELITEQENASEDST